MKKLVALVLSIFCFSSLMADKLADLKRKNIIHIGVQSSFEPFTFKNRAGEQIGFNIDLAEYIASELKLEYRVKSDIDIKNLVENINGNHIDIAIVPIVHTTKLDKDVDFTISYFYNGQTLLVGKNDNAKNYKDFASKKVASVEAKRASAFKIIEPLVQIVSTNTYEDALELLKGKKVAAITGDYATLSRLATKNKTKVKLLAKPFTVEPYGIVIRENQSNLRDELNRIIQKSVKTGEYEKLYKKWFRKSPFKEPILWP